MATTVAHLQAILGADTRGFDQSMDRSEGRMKKVGKVAGIAGLAIAGGLAVGLKKSMDAAIESQKAEVRLTSAMDQAKISARGRAAANEAISKTSTTRNSPTSTRSSSALRAASKKRRRG
jgi:hypothetical protein